MANLRPHAHHAYATTGALSATRVALGRREGSLEVHTLATGAMTHARQLFVPGEESASALAFSKDSEVLAALGSSGSLFVWDLGANTLQVHRIDRRGGTPSLVLSDDGRALTLMLAGDVWQEEREPDGFVRMWADPASDTLVAEVRGGQMKQVRVEGTWEPLPGSPHLMQRIDGDVQSIEAWRWEGEGVRRELLMTAPRSEKIEALSPSRRWALVQTSAGRQMMDREKQTTATLADSWSGQVLGFVEEEVCLVYERGPMRLASDGTCTRIYESASQSAPLASTPAFLLERSDFLREQLISPRGEVRVLSERVDTVALVSPSARRLDVVSYTPSRSHGAFNHGGEVACELRGSRVALFDLAVSADAQIVVGVDADGVVRRWRREDGVQLGEAPLFSVEADKGCLPALTLDPTGSFAVERNQVLRCFDLTSFTEVSRFAYQKKRADAPVEDPSVELDRKAERKLEAAWDVFFALRERWSPSLTLSPSAAQLFCMDSGGVLALLPDGKKKKKHPSPEGAEAVSFTRDGLHVAFSTSEGAALFSLAPFRELASWSRAGAGRLADADARWMVLTRGAAVDVCDARTGAVRWSCEVPSFDQPGAAEVYVHGEGARLSFVRGGHVVSVEQHERGGRVVIELVVLPGGELLATGKDGWWATPGAFAHAHLTRGGRAASTLEDARSAWGEPNAELLSALLVTRTT